MDYVLMGLTVFTYGANFILYHILKKKPKIQGFEKLSILFGVNMSVLLVDGLLLFIAKVLYDHLVLD